MLLLLRYATLFADTPLRCRHFFDFFVMITPPDYGYFDDATCCLLMRQLLRQLLLPLTR